MKRNGTGHLGKQKTKEKLSQRFFWFEMREDESHKKP
jgi:hypothetical protein